MTKTKKYDTVSRKKKRRRKRRGKEKEKEKIPKNQKKLINSIGNKKKMLVLKILTEIFNRNVFKFSIFHKRHCTSRGACSIKRFTAVNNPTAL